MSVTKKSEGGKAVSDEAANELEEKRVTRKVNQ
jgi:hypothetical protein